MMDTVLSFVASEFVGIFALLFLNNLLMYLVGKRHFNKVWGAQEERHKIVLDWAGRQEQTLRAVVHAFKDEAEGAVMPAFECGKCNTPADCEDWCYHVLVREEAMATTVNDNPIVNHTIGYL